MDSLMRAAVRFSSTGVRAVVHGSTGHLDFETILSV